METYFLEIETKTDFFVSTTLILLLPETLINSDTLFLYSILLGPTIDNFKMVIPIAKINPKTAGFVKTLLNDTNSLKEIQTHMVIHPRLHYFIPFYEK
jgi:hypothetical protein